MRLVVEVYQGLSPAKQLSWTIWGTRSLIRLEIRVLIAELQSGSNILESN